jgi:hypothetical protein
MLKSKAQNFTKSKLDRRSEQESLPWFSNLKR